MLSLDISEILKRSMNSSDGEKNVERHPCSGFSFCKNTISGEPGAQGRANYRKYQCREFRTTGKQPIPEKNLGYHPDP